jgi:hypothetical protein
MEGRGWYSGLPSAGADVSFVSHTQCARTRQNTLTPGR